MRIKNRHKLIIIAFLAMLVILGGCFHKPSQVNNNVNVSPVNGNVNIANGDEIDTSDWLTYRNEEYGYQIKYPEDWNVGELSRYEKEFEKLTKNVSFNNGDYALVFLFKKKNEDIIIGRTGISAGDFENERVWNMGDMELKVRDLTYEEKLKEVFFSGKDHDYDINGYFSFRGDNYVDDFVFDKDQILIAKNIMKSFRINTETVVDEIDTSDWKTYRNEEYGFEMKYPSDWKLKDDIDDGIKIDGKEIFKLSKYFINKYDYQDGSFFKLIVYDNEKKVTLKQWTDNHFDDFKEANTLINRSTIKVSGIEAEYGEFTSDVAGGYVNNTILIYENMIYRIFSGRRIHPELLEKNKEHHQQLNKILDLFEFSNKDEIFDWQTYRNKKYGIKFEYPKKWRFLGEKLDSFTTSFGRIGVNLEYGIFENTENKSPKEWVDERDFFKLKQFEDKDVYVAYGFTDKIQNIKINSNIELINYKGGASGGGVFETAIIPFQNKIIVITYSLTIDFSGNAKEQKNRASNNFNKLLKSYSITE